MDDKRSMFLDYCELLNSLDSGATTKLTINNRRIKTKELTDSLLVSDSPDGLDEYRTEYNRMLVRQALRAESNMQDKYVTVSVTRKNIAEAKEFLDDLTTRDRRMMLAVLTLVHTADTLELLDGNSFILGVSGSGKSFAGKNEITNLMLSSDADIIVIDPEREYAPLVRALGGEVIEISATSPNHINAMDMGADYGEVDPVIEKSQFLFKLWKRVRKYGAYCTGITQNVDDLLQSHTAGTAKTAESAGRIKKA